MKSFFRFCGCSSVRFSVQKGSCKFFIKERDQRSHEERRYDRPDIDFSKYIDAADSAEHCSGADTNKITDNPAILKPNSALLF